MSGWSETIHTYTFGFTGSIPRLTKRRGIERRRIREEDFLDDLGSALQLGERHGHAGGRDLAAERRRSVQQQSQVSCEYASWDH